MEEYGKEESLEALQKILAEIAEMFPYEMIHIGGDEACKQKWSACKYCQKKIKEEHLKDENALQQWFIKQIKEYLTSLGKKVIVWNDSLRGGELEEDFIVQAWMGDQEAITEFVQRGGKIIHSDTKAYYLDYPYHLIDVKKILEYPVCPEYIENIK